MQTGSNAVKKWAGKSNKAISSVAQLTLLFA